MELIEAHIFTKHDIVIHDYYPFGYTGTVKAEDGETYIVILPTYGKNLILNIRDFDGMSYQEFMAILTQ